ncbi:outer membrane lipoprotein-sorting protein [Balneolaceae bacterium ANBcel3]|nr:outer membrane lipoprotein-sorting protein [Balneolaceae bacterium ANBcel3]
MKQIWVVSFMLVVMCTQAYAMDAQEIIRRMDQTMRGESSFSEMTMTIERPRFTREVSMRAWSLGQDYSLILITAPSRDQGTTFLKRGNEVWNYVPSIDRTIKMPPSMMSESWMGSDFTNDDLVRESSVVEDYEHTLLRTETIRDHECYVVEMIPKPDTPVVWGKVIVWVSKENFMQLRIENYDQREQLKNVIELDEIRDVGDRIIPTRFTLTPEDKEGHKTIITYSEMGFGIDISESYFTQQNMRRVR